jgi:hypothetical protein
MHEDAPLIDAQIAVQWARTVLAEPISLKYVEAVGAEHFAKIRRKVETKLGLRSTAWRIPKPRLPAAGRSRRRWGSWHECPDASFP